MSFDELTNNSFTNKILEDKLIMFIPGVSKSGKYKQWSSQKFAALAKILENKSFKICVVGQNSDREITDIIKKNCKKKLFSSKQRYWTRSYCSFK